MEMVQINNDLSFSRLVYGMWRLADDADQSPAHVQAKIEACLEQGITTFDQADIYGGYACEAVLGNTLHASPSLRSQMQIITKCDIVLPGDQFSARVKFYDTSAEHINTSVENSLRHMAIEQIDLLLIHRPDPLMDHFETGSVLDALVKSGKVRAVGVSNFKAWDWDLLQSAMKTRLVTNQIELSLLSTEAFINGDIATLQQKGIAPMAWSPLGGGQLFDKSNSKLHDLQTGLAQIADAQGVGIDAVALAWLLKHPSGILPVVGTNNLDRIRKLSDATKVTLDRQTWFDLYTRAIGQEVP